MEDLVMETLTVKYHEIDEQMETTLTYIYV